MIATKIGFQFANAPSGYLIQMRVDLNNDKASINVKAFSKSSRIWVVLYLIIIFSMYVQFLTNYGN